MGLDLVAGDRWESFADMAAKVARDDGIGRADLDYAAVIEPHDAVAQSFDVGGGVGDEEHGDAAGAQLMNFAHAALAKVDIAHGEGFIHQQNLGVDVNGDGEGEADGHAARIGLDGLVDELADFGEVFDVAVSLVDLAFGEAQNGGVEVDVVAAAEIRG